MQVFIKPANYIDVSLLYNVGCIDSCQKPAVKAQLDHAPEPGSMLGKNLIQSRLVPGTSLLQKAGCIGGVVVHQGPHVVLTPAEAVYWTG
jgi:hypothetical protein